MVLLKLDMLTLEETVNVSVAAVDAPADRLVPSLFQVMVMKLPAEAGLHPEMTILSAIVPVPVFLT